MIVQDVDRATLIGESLGGAIVLHFALQYPQQVEKMVLYDSVVWEKSWRYTCG